MYVSIDMTDLHFVHKHEDVEVLRHLAWLELPHKSVTIESTDREFFLCKMSGLDLRFLYRNTTGEEPPLGTEHLVVREMLATIVAEKLKATFADLSELEAQVALVEDDLYKGIAWKYALGARRPAKQEELVWLSCNPLDSSEIETLAVRAPQRRAVPQATPRAAPGEQRPTGPHSRQPRASNIRPRIWHVADSMWEEAGKPMDKTVVLELRKKMMAVLETEHGIKRTSSSNELGNWQKDRLSVN
jgi:hypothetical protein